ncbi:MAG TPA: ABC transporter permease [Bryobacteraceae bacterium]|nr:ABC transporter permease [Bryobacteraceae bacterium]
MNWRRRRRENDLERELRADLELETEEQRHRGLPPQEARWAAQRAFGNTSLVKEDVRDAWGWVLLYRFKQDLIYALRGMRKSPAFTMTAVLSLALGIGANTTIFSLMDALMLRRLPVAHPEQLVLFGAGQGSGTTDDFPHGRTDLFSQPFYHEVRARKDVYSDIAAMESMSIEPRVRFSGTGSEAEPVTMRLVSGNYFSMLGAGAAIGRVLDSNDDTEPGANPVAVMSHRLWERRFGAQPDVLDRTLSFNGTVYRIVGVASREFFGTEVGAVPDFWIPISMQAQAQPWLNGPLDKMTQSLWLIGRMRPGITTRAAQSISDLVFHQWLRELTGAAPSPDRIEDMRHARIELTPAARGLSRLRRRFSRPLLILMIVTGLVLLIACANIANLLLARGTAREREIAVRSALGAGRGRLISQLLSESLMLALGGGALGVLAALYGSRVLLAMVSPGRDSISLDAGPNGTVLLFTLALALSTGLVFGILPALRSTHLGAAASLREGKGLSQSHFNNRTGQALVATQVALALFLMIGAGLFVRTLLNLETANTGFDKDRTLLLSLEMDSSAAQGPALVNIFRRIESRIQNLPGVEAASFAMSTFHEGHWSSMVWPYGAPHTESTGIVFEGNRVGAEYFHAMGIPILKGRGFGPQDTPHSPAVAVVDETFARKLFPNVSPLGRRFDLGGPVEIVGVARDVKHETLREQDRGNWFLFNSQENLPDGFNDLVVRCQGDTGGMTAAIRDAIRQEDSRVAISQATTLREQVDDSLGQERLLAKLAGFFALVALSLSAIGIYGVMSYRVARRSNEIGIRMALGARPADVLGGILRESLMLVAAGFLVAIPAALVCGRLVATQLYGVAPGDFQTIAMVAGALLVTALAAGFVPARRAARLDPMAALRSE